MKISTQATKYLNDHYGSAGDPAPEGVDKLVEVIGAQLAAVEETIDFGKRFEDVVIVKVVSCEHHPNADRLHVCKVDDGGKAQNVERDENGLVQIVCGAPNVRAGMFAAWLPPGSTVPSTADAEPFVLTARDIRGTVSNGMLASPKELSLGDNHDGILDIDEELGSLAPGTMFVDAFHLRGDAIIDMENKMFTHRPDCFGWLGLSREIEGIQHRAYKSPAWYSLDADLPAAAGPITLPIRVQNEVPDLVPRFVAVALGDVQVKPSPVWLQVDLARAGLRSINNIVDYTNFYMLLTGQPLHAYDYDKVKARSNDDAATLVIRHPRSGEKLLLLNGKEIEPRPEAIMIATNTELIGVGGVMGGNDTEVDANTTHIILEAANFDMYSVRRTSMAHGLFTDAVTRFNKGQSPLQNRAVMCKIVDQICQFAGGKVEGVVDDNHLAAEIMQRGNVHAPVSVSTRFINERLGWSLPAEAIKTLLENVEFGVAVDGDELTVSAPFWRTDIEIPEDVVEEVGRLNGYDKLPLDLPKRSIAPPARNEALALQYKIRGILSSAGANEALGYSFVHGNLLDKVGQNRDQAFQLSNALSPDLQYFRLSLMPSLLDKVHPNIKAGHDQFALFELGKVHSKDMLDEDGLPKEFARVALVYAASEKLAGEAYAGAPYYQARTYLDTLLARFGVVDDIVWQPLAQADFGGHSLIEQMAKPFEPGRAAVLVKNGLIVGVVGEYRRSVQRALKLPAFSAGFETFLSFLSAGPGATYARLSRFPKVEQDICLKVSGDLPYGELFRFVQDQLEDNRPQHTDYSLGPVDIYQRQDDTAHKQITLRLTLASHDRTLTDEETNKILDQVAQAAKSELGAERI